MLVGCFLEVYTAFSAADVWYVHVSLAARSRTYFGRERADAAVDYGLGRTDVRSVCCVGHGGFDMALWLLVLRIPCCDLSLKFLSRSVTMEGHFGLLGGVPLVFLSSAKRFSTSLLNTTSYIPPW
jgi:hypothetical protein